MKIAGYTVRNNVVTEIGKFAILWNCFEHFICDNNCNIFKIINIGKSINIDEAKMNMLREAVKNRMELFGVDSTSYVVDGLYPDGSKKAHKEENQRDIEQHMKQFIDNNAAKPAIGCLLVISRIRNNMMHGLKDVSDLGKQLELFQAVNGVLEDLI